MQKHFIVILLTIILTILLLFIATIWVNSMYRILPFAFLLLGLLPFISRFEQSRWSSKKILLISSLVGIASVSRLAFQAIPGVQPASFIVIMSGAFFGREIGFMIGMATGFVSNIFLGQGPWTPWQMFAWGMMGMSAGLFFHHRLSINRFPLLFFSIIWGYGFGWLLNLWYLIGFVSPITISSLLGVYLASFAFDTLHAVGNACFILVFYHKWARIFERIQLKYLD